MPVIEEWRKEGTRKVVGNIADRRLILHQKNAHFHTYIRMGLYIRMCSSIRTYVVSCVTWRMKSHTSGQRTGCFF